MKKVLLFVFASLMFSIEISAQASGGQITRKRTNTITTTNTTRKNNSSGKTTTIDKRDVSGNRNDTPQIKVINESEKTCELYFDRDKQNTCIPRNKKGKYVIPSTVRGYTVIRIGDCAFNNCEISEIEIPNTVTSIGNDAFGWCFNLSNIIIPKSVKSIGDRCFDRCESLLSLSMSNSKGRYRH